MKCQILFSGKIKNKNFNMSAAENFTQGAMHQTGSTCIFERTFIHIHVQKFLLK